MDQSPSLTADLDSLGDTLVSEIPEPQGHAIEEATRAAAAENPQTVVSGELDELGVPWNPEFHATGADGKGIRTAKGAWRKRRGVAGSRPYLNTSAANSAPAEPKEDPSVTEQRTLEHQNRMAGAMAGTMLVRISAAVGGKEFLPRNITAAGVTYNEEQFLQTAFGDYFVAKGISDIPPGMVLASALCMYYLPRFQEPAVKERAGGFMHWVKKKGSQVWVWWKYRKGGKPPEKANGKSGADQDGVFDSTGAAQKPVPDRELRS